MTDYAKKQLLADLGKLSGISKQNDAFIEKCAEYQAVFEEDIMNMPTGFTVCISAMNGGGKSNICALSAFYKHTLYINLESNSSADCAVKLHNKKLLEYWGDRDLHSRKIIDGNNDFSILEFKKQVYDYCASNKERIKVVIIDSIAELFERFAQAKTNDVGGYTRGKIDLSRDSMWGDMSKYMKQEMCNLLNILLTDLNGIGISVIFTCPLQQVDEKDEAGKVYTKIDYQTQWKACKEYLNKNLNGVYVLGKGVDSVYDGLPCVKDQAIYSGFDETFATFLMSRDLTIAKDVGTVRNTVDGKVTTGTAVKARKIGCNTEELSNGVIRIGIFQMLYYRALKNGCINLRRFKDDSGVK